MAKRRRNKVVLWEWSRSGKGKGLKPGFALIATGLGFLYFGWLYSATGIFTGRRGRVAIVASEEPE